MAKDLNVILGDIAMVDIIEVFENAIESAIRKGVCFECRKPAWIFSDEESRNQYGETGLCQCCQDSMKRDAEIS